MLSPTTSPLSYNHFPMEGESGLGALWGRPNDCGLMGLW